MNPQPNFEETAIPSIPVKDEMIYASDIEDGINKDFSLCEKIAASYNNTYGKGFRPESLEELYKALELFLKVISSSQTALYYFGEDIKIAEIALTNSKL